MGNKVFVLGSGYSKAVTDYPTLNELSSLVIEKIKNNSEIEIDKFAKSSYEYLKKNTPPTIIDNVEHLLSYLWQDQPWHTNIEKQYAKATYSYIISIIQDVFTQKIVFGEEARLLAEYWRDNSSTIISFNYDTVVEDIAIKSKFISDYLVNYLYKVAMHPVSARYNAAGYLSEPPPEKRFTLLKLHGSINWLYSGDQSFAGQSIYFVSNQKEAKEHGDLIPVIIPPVLDKTNLYFHTGLRFQWRVAKEALQIADEIYFIGYSLPQTDLSVRFFLGESLIDSSGKLNVVISEKDVQKAEVIKQRYSELTNGKSDRLIFKNPQSNSLGEVLSSLKSNISKS